MSDKYKAYREEQQKMEDALRAIESQAYKARMRIMDQDEVQGSIEALKQFVQELDGKNWNLEKAQKAYVDELFTEEPDQQS
jgi:hypothetical protein